MVLGLKVEDPTIDKDSRELETNKKTVEANKKVTNTIRETGVTVGSSPERAF
jgi:hypothetical protein